MRETLLVLNGSFCDMNLYADGPQTYAEACNGGRQMCPNFQKCNSGALHPVSGLQCTMVFGLQVAQESLKAGKTIAQEMEDFRRAELHPSKGWIVSDDRKEFLVVPDGGEDVFTQVEKFAHIALNDSDKALHRDPRMEIGSDFASVVRYATTRDGAIDLSKMQKLEGRFGYNGNRGCDVQRGPCSCGAWH